MIELAKGDIFCTRNPMMLGRIINWNQKFWSSDNESTYSHAGIILDPDGTTFESLWTIKKSHLSRYKGKKILIGRHIKMDEWRFSIGWLNVKRHQGQLYPFHRLFLMIIPPVAKYISTGRFPVCSELTAKFLCETHLLDFWKGKNPDDIADMIHKWREYEIVFEGKWE